jgi:AraC family transcriptional regulator
MKCSKPGQFYGKTNEKLLLNGMILDDSIYIHDRVDWHYHQNPYFTFLLHGGVIEGSKKGINECSSGSLLFHNSENPHYNIGTKLPTRGFHVEVTRDWFSSFEVPDNIAAGTVNITDPRIRMLMYRIFKETKLGDQTKQLSIDSLMIEIFTLLSSPGTAPANRAKPGWLQVITEALHTTTENWQLDELAKLAGVHPVHLCREFHRHFNTTVGDYIRTVKIRKALALLPDKDLSLTDISILCGFADQSHFIRVFKSFQQITPLQYRKLLLNHQAC